MEGFLSSDRKRIETMGGSEGWSLGSASRYYPFHQWVNMIIKDPTAVVKENGGEFCEKYPEKSKLILGKPGRAAKEGGDAKASPLV